MSSCTTEQKPHFFIFQILNQDAAKTFLFKCDEYKLYEFFMRATQVCSLMKPILFQSFPSRPTNSKIWPIVDLTCMMTQIFSSTGCEPGGSFCTKSNKKNINNSSTITKHCLPAMLTTPGSKSDGFADGAIQQRCQ